MKCPFCGSKHDEKPHLNIICSCGAKYYIHTQEWWSRTTGEKMSQRVYEEFLALGYSDVESIRLAKLALNPVTTETDINIIRCKECDIRGLDEDGYWVCTGPMAYAATPDDWFCAGGIPKGSSKNKKEH